MRKFFVDMRSIPTGVFLDNSVSIDSESFVHGKYVFGCPNTSPLSTLEGAQLALERIMPEQDESLFGTHIKETLYQFRTLFGKR